MIGPGKYDEICTAAFESAQAEAVLLVVMGGNKGHGFSCQAVGEKVLKLPALLRHVADQIEKDCHEANA